MRRRKAGERHSGGFLLDSGLFGGLRPTAKKGATSGGTVGKSKNKGKDNVTPSSRTSKSIGEDERKSTNEGSPLSNEVTMQDNTGPSRFASSRQSSTPNDLHFAAHEEHQRPLSSFDSGPAQIVNLALNLSENRRRQLNNGRLSSLPAAGGRRIVSTPRMGTATAGSPLVGGSLRHHLNQQKKHRNEPVTPERAKLSTDYFSPVQQETEQQREADIQPLLPGIDFEDLASPQFSATDATLARAEKARVTIGLSHQHLRLLQYLPKLPTTSGGRLSTSRGGPRHEPEKSQPLGRAYNPLQYLRNRRVRARESRTLNSEGDGWKDLEKVKMWVDAVVDERSEGVSRVDDEYPLPPFKPVGAELVPETTYLSTTISRTGGPPLAKAPRQRTDWSTTPWDMLGDVYWLNEAENKDLIEDREGNKVFTQKTSFDLSALKRESTRPFSRRSASITRRPKVRSDSSEPPGKEETVADRGRRRHQPHDSIKSIDEYSSSRDRKSKWPRKLIKVQSDLSSDESEQGSIQGIPRIRGQPNSRDLQATVLLELQVRELLAQEAVTTEEAASKKKEDDAKREVLRPALALDSQGRKVNRDGESLHMDRVQYDEGDEVGGESQNAAHKHGHRSTQSMDYLDSSVPNSPDKRPMVPSIAINLSPPSRPHPSHKPKSLPQRSILGELDKELQKVETIDFAPTQKQPHKLQKSRSPEPTNDRSSSQLHTADKTSTTTRLRKGIGESKNFTGHSDPKEARLRGLLKGARLSDVVSNPISKVRDMSWRREDANRSRPQSPASSYAPDASETDEERRNPGGLQDLESGIDGSNQEFSYHLQNLPVFKSPFKANGAGLKMADQDHITRQQRGLKAQRSRRFEKLAPPSLDMRSVSSPEPSPPHTPNNEKDGFVSDDSRRPSSGDRRLAVVEGSPDALGRKGYPVTGTSEPTLSAGSPDQWNHGIHSFSAADLNLKLSNDKVTRADIIRVKALLDSTGTKTSGVIRVSSSIRMPPLPLLQTLGFDYKDIDWPLPRKLEQVKAGQLLTAAIDKDAALTQEAMNVFSNETVVSLDKELRGLENHVSSRLTDLVRAASDQAEDLGSELTTTDSLKVKRLNESVDLIMRRRRRRFRNLRRGLYLLLEWTLLGLMWWVWLIVVVVRLARGSISGSYRVVKWLFWF